MCIIFKILSKNNINKILIKTFMCNFDMLEWIEINCPTNINWVNKTKTIESKKVSRYARAEENKIISIENWIIK